MSATSLREPRIAGSAPPDCWRQGLFSPGNRRSANNGLTREQITDLLTKKYDHILKAEQENKD
jgi:hypothetical protein